MSTLIISPTPGRVVWYFPSQNDGIPAEVGQPLPAIVAAVFSDRLVNLAIFDHYGNRHARQNVQLVQEGDAYIAEAGRAEWMPYQREIEAKKLATKTQSLTTESLAEVPTEASARASADATASEAVATADDATTAPTIEDGAEAAATQEQQQ